MVDDYGVPFVPWPIMKATTDLATFSAAVLDDERYTYSMQTASGVIDAENGNVVRDLKVFRSGSFKDSKGRRHDIDHDDLEAMVGNFRTLRDRGLLVDVPVRADHSASINSVVGYITDVRRDGDFLLADLEFTEPDAAAKYARRTYRARSLEVAPYESNDGEVFHPAVMGLAFVDIGAVEGLFGRHRPDADPNKETDPVNFRIRGVNTSDADAIQSHIDELEKRPEKLPEPVSFRIAGAPTNDVAAVQTHIEALETFQNEVASLGRTEFVEALAKDGKIAATQIEAYQSFVKDMAPEAFSNFRKLYDAEGTPALFANHGSTGTPAKPADGSVTELEVVRETVTQFRRAGLSEEQIEKTEAYRKMVALEAK